ncbi:MAG: alpha/beta fold hydrolase [Actinophytocola sp.]|nr:alpha/beta fold hydrolase [Actinophytocola sp.]
MIEADYRDVDGARVYVEQAGTGSPVVCLHTAGQSGVQWRDTIAELASLGYRVVVPDLPGHGRSEPATGGPISDLGHYASWCERLIDELGLRRPYVVGCSIGGKITLDLAARMGSRLAGAVAMAASAGSGTVNLRALRRELEDVSAPSRSERTYLGTLAVVGRAVPAERAELIASMHRREDPVVSTSDLIGWGSHDVRARLAEISCPVRVVAGADDLWISADDARATAASIPLGQFTLLDGVGHYPMEELPDFAEVLAGWLRALDGHREP